VFQAERIVFQAERIVFQAERIVFQAERIVFQAAHVVFQELYSNTKCSGTRLVERLVGKSRRGGRRRRFV